MMNRIKNLNPVYFCAHVGSSMNPTLYEMDLLEIAPYGERTIHVGDVIFFRTPEEEHSVVHRVVSVTPKGIRTRGDNNSLNDPYFLQSGDIVGQVVATWRGQKHRKITGGLAGWLTAHLIRRHRIFKRRFLYPLLRPIYDFLLHWSILHRLLPSRFRPRVVIFQINGRNHLQLLFGKRIVGRYDAQRHQWDIQRLFRLFVDERSLPGTQAMENISSNT